MRRRKCAARRLGQPGAAAAAARSASSSSWCSARRAAGTASRHIRRRLMGRHTWLLLAVLVALLVGLAIGKAWERYKLQDGRWIDRRRARESPHYMLGPELPRRQPDRSGDRGADAGGADAGDPLEIHLILGNLYREKGRSAARSRSTRRCCSGPNLRKLEHANVLLCLGLDYKRGGFVDRALEAFTEVLRLDPDNRYALSNLEKLYEEQHQWEEAYATRQKLARCGAGAGEAAASDEILAFLENELGLQALKRMDYRRGGAALRGGDRARSAEHAGLSEPRRRALPSGRHGGAIAVWERLIETLARSRLPRLLAARGGISQDRRARTFPELCRRLIAANPQDWRARLALARHLSTRTASPRRARAAVRGAGAQPARARAAPGDLADAVAARPAAALVERYVDLTRDAGVLPRPAHLPPLPLPQHRAALAVSALPRVEHVRRGADRAGEGRPRRR